MVLSLIIEKTQAWELLHNPEQASKLTVVGLQEVMLRAGYPPDVVQQAINKRGMDRLSNDMVM